MERVRGRVEVRVGSGGVEWRVETVERVGESGGEWESGRESGESEESEGENPMVLSTH